MSNELDLRQYMAIIKKRLALILVFVFLCTAAAAVISMFFKDPVYEASTKIIVNQTTTQMATASLILIKSTPILK